VGTTSMVGMWNEEMGALGWNDEKEESFSVCTPTQLVLAWGRGSDGYGVDSMGLILDASNYLASRSLKSRYSQFFMRINLYAQ